MRPWPTVRETRLALACAALWPFAAPALADDAAVVPSDTETPAPALADAEPRVHITVSRAADLVGRPAYAERSAFATTSSQVSLSYTPVVGRIGGTASLPASMPLAARRVSSDFGMRRNPVTGLYAAHSGVDLPAPAGAPIVATADGVVGSAAWSGGYGLMVVVEHAGGLETRYAHMSRLNVVAGQRVHAGDVLGFVGSTGRSTGPHLHYETRVNGRAVDPLGG